MDRKLCKNTTCRTKHNYIATSRCQVYRVYSYVRIYLNKTFGKVRRAEKAGAGFADYRYDGLNNKTLIKVTDEDGTTHLRHYVRDASGNVLAIYTDNALTEHHIYGSARIGIAKAGTEKYHQTLAHKHYELSNHLGNILSVISDNKYKSGTIYAAFVVSQTDYLAYGQAMPDRSFNTTAIRYTFNGKEDEIFSEWQDYGFRNYDKKQRRFTSVDPLTAKYTCYTPYQFAGNRVIEAVDLDGLEELRVTYVGSDVQYKREFVGEHLGELSPQHRPKLKTGKDIIKALETKQTEEILIWLNFSHGQRSIFAKDDPFNGLSSSLNTGEMVASLGDLKAKIDNNEVKFTKNGLIILGNCNSGYYKFAPLLAQITGMYVIAATDAFAPKDEKNGLLYLTDGQFLKFHPDGKREVMGKKLDVVSVVNEAASEFLRSRAVTPINLDELGTKPHVDIPDISPEHLKPIEGQNEN